MHARQLLDVATTLAPAVRPTADALAEYWVASRCRLDQWGRALRQLADSRSVPTRQPADSLARLVEEIAFATPLARLLAAATHAGRVDEATREDATLASNTWVGHLEATQRLDALTRVWWPRGTARGAWAQLLRDETDDLADWLIATATHGEASSFAKDASRVKRYRATCASPIARSPDEPVTQPLCPELNARIAAAGLAMAPSEAFDGFGLLRPAWAVRLDAGGPDAWADPIDPFGVGAPNTSKPRWRA